MKKKGYVITCTYSSFWLMSVCFSGLSASVFIHPSQCTVAESSSLNFVSGAEMIVLFLSS